MNLQVWRNTGGNSLTFVKIVDLQSTVKEHTVNLADSAGMTAGVIYKFKVRTENDQGPSEFSDELDAAVSSFPAKPAMPTRVLAQSGTNFVTLQWSVSADTELPVLGYVINMDDGYGANYRTVYNGKFYPNVLQYTVGGL